MCIRDRSIRDDDAQYIMSLVCQDLAKGGKKIIEGLIRVIRQALQREQRLESNSEHQLQRDVYKRQAHAIISQDSKYINEVYGEKQGGGTRWLYISDVPFEQLGFPTNVPEKSIPATVHDYSKWKPGIFAGGLVVFLSLIHI